MTKFKFNNDGMEIAFRYCRFSNGIFLLVLLIICNHFSGLAQPNNSKIGELDLVICLPSSDCINCKAQAVSVLQGNSLFDKFNNIHIVTNDDAGLYYISKLSISKNYKVIKNKELCTFLAKNGKSSFNLKVADGYITFDINYGIDTIINISNKLRQPNMFKLLRTDSVILPYNIFNEFGNFLFTPNYTNDSLFLFSKVQNVGCFLNTSSTTVKQDTIELIPTETSHGRYEQFYNELLCARHSNMTQSSLRAFSSSSGIPLTKIFGISSNAIKDYLCYNFFTGKSDTIREDSISQILKYNVIISSRLKNANNPINLENYDLSMKIEDSFIHKGFTYKTRTIADFVVTDNYIFLPASRLNVDGTANDDVFYMAKYNLKDKNNSNPDDVILYNTAHFLEESLIRAFDDKVVIVNKIKKSIDFGNFHYLEFASIKFNKSNEERLEEIYEFKILKDGILEIVGKTNKGRIVVGKIENEINLISSGEILTNEQPIFCKLSNDKLIVVVSKNNMLYTSVYSK